MLKIQVISRSDALAKVIRVALRDRLAEVSELSSFAAFWGSLPNQSAGAKLVVVESRMLKDITLSLYAERIEGLPTLKTIVLLEEGEDWSEEVSTSQVLVLQRPLSPQALLRAIEKLHIPLEVQPRLIDKEEGLSAEELQALIHQEVTAYCRLHFKAIAKEVLQEELKKLAERQHAIRGA